MKLIQVDKEKGGITLQAARDGIEHDVCGMVSLSELVESNDDTVMDDGGNMATWCLRKPKDDNVEVCGLVIFGYHKEM